MSAREFVARAEADGYTLLLTTIGTGAINFAVYGDKMPYKPADLAAVGLLVARAERADGGERPAGAERRGAGGADQVARRAG